jgi:hypothetical protein
MTDQQRQQRAAFIREQPGLWLVLLYSVTYFGCAVAGDVLQWASGVVSSRVSGYLLPLVIALPLWVGLRDWARRVRASAAGERLA